MGDPPPERECEILAPEKAQDVNVGSISRDYECCGRKRGDPLSS